MSIDPLSSMTAVNPSLVDKAADAASSAIESTRGMGDESLDRLSDKVESARQQIQPAMDRLTEQAASMSRRSIQTLREGSAQLRDKVAAASETTASHIRDEPLKAMLVSAAVGAAFMALITLVSHSRRRA